MTLQWGEFYIAEETDNCVVNFAVIKGDYFVSTETSQMHKVDLDTLESKEKVKERSRLPGIGLG